MNPTPAQLAQEKTIVDYANSQIAAIRSLKGLSPQEKIRKLQQIRMDADHQMTSILTPEQQAKLAARQQQIVQSQSAVLVDGLDRALHLSPDQKTKLLSIIQGGMVQESAIMNNAALSLDQKRAGVKTLRGNLLAQVNSVLTPKQAQVMEAAQARQAQAARPPVISAPGLAAPGRR